jgi:hypothetical protein
MQQTLPHEMGIAGEQDLLNRGTVVVHFEGQGPHEYTDSGKESGQDGKGQIGTNIGQFLSMKMRAFRSFVTLATTTTYKNTGRKDKGGRQEDCQTGQEGKGG